MGGGVIGPRNNVFPGPAVALDGPGVRGADMYPYSVADTASLANVTLNMRYGNDKTISNSSSPDLFNFFQAQNAPKPVFGQGSASDPAGGAYDAPRTP